MRGLITTSDVLLHPLIIVAAFGLRVYARCLVRLVAGCGRATLLECAWGPLPASTVAAAGLAEWSGGKPRDGLQPGGISS